MTIASVEARMSPAFRFTEMAGVTLPTGNLSCPVPRIAERCRHQRSDANSEQNDSSNDNSGFDFNSSHKPENRFNELSHG